jgi:hypothetical protein
MPWLLQLNPGYRLDSQQHTSASWGAPELLPPVDHLMFNLVTFIFHLNDGCFIKKKT